MNYPRWIQKAAEAFEAYYDDRFGQQGVALLEEALLEAIAAGYLALPRSPFSDLKEPPVETEQTKQLRALNKELEFFRMQKELTKTGRMRFGSEAELKRIVP